MENENKIYELPLATFTFGQESLNSSNKKEKKSQNSLNSNINKFHLTTKNQKSKNKNINTEFINNSNFQNNSAQNYNIISGELCELTFGKDNNLITSPSDSINNNNIKEKNKFKIPVSDKININQNKLKKNYPLFINPQGNNDNYIFAILYAIYHMKLFYKYIINDLTKVQDKLLNNNSILYELREILNQINKNKFINISNFRQSLSNLFQNHRKFLLGQTDDPADLLFVIINSIHSFNINFPLNEISDEACTEKCFSHKFLWLDLSRIDICKCSGNSKRLFSNHNYITDIPMVKIFNFMKLNLKKTEKDENFILYESNQKLFEYYTKIISRMKTDCPANGQRCPINKTFHKLHLSNSPSYLIFNLEQHFQEINQNYAFSAVNILKNFVLIPPKFDIWDLFELNSKKNKNFFDFIGCVLFKISKVYSCAFKNKAGSITYYDCNNYNINDYYNNSIIEFVSYFDFVLFCIKNGLIPVLLFYQGNFLSKKNKNNLNINNNYEDNLTKEQIITLEKYCINNDNLCNILLNNLRKKDHLIMYKNNNIKKNILEENKNNSFINRYICPKCNFENQVTDKICIKCNSNNSEFLLKNDINRKKISIKNINKLKLNNESKSLNHSSAFTTKLKSFNLLHNKFQNSQNNINNNHKKNEIMMIQINNRKKVCISPDIKLKDSDKFFQKYNFEAYPDKDKSKNYLINMPSSFKPKKKIHKNNNKDQKYSFNINDIEKKNSSKNINNKLNINLNKINIVKRIEASPKNKNLKIIPYNIRNISSHKKVLSSSEQNDLLNNSKLNRSNSNNFIKDSIKPINMNLKNRYQSRTIVNTKNKSKEKRLKNNVNNIIKTEVDMDNDNYIFRNIYDKNNDINRFNKVNENYPIYPINYSYNDINFAKKKKL